ncbi:MAG: hypothetical protein LBN05_01025 [Oscillospiraceae bacterium]|nr:hypothetical protein [Oscillospiraceae bacterium]
MSDGLIVPAANEALKTSSAVLDTATSFIQLSREIRASDKTSKQLRKAEEVIRAKRVLATVSMDELNIFDCLTQNSSSSEHTANRANRMATILESSYYRMVDNFGE